MTAVDPRIHIDVRLTPEQRRQMLLDDARAGLASTPKWLSPVWFYDERGSALFDEITRLPEYYPTRAERSLLRRHADEITRASRAVALIELGSGTSDKTGVLLDAMTREGSLRCYAPLDVDEATLRSAAVRLAEDRPGLEITGVVGDFRHHLHAFDTPGPRLLAFLGGTIGNLLPRDRARFLFDVDCMLHHEDRFLLGVDLVKDPARLIRAYDDRAGVTAEFNRNALRVLSAELGGSIDPTLFDHVARWDAENQWIEMWLRAQRDLVVALPGIETEARFAAGEGIRTEISAKFTADGIAGELYEAGLIVEESWEHELGYLLVLARPYC